MKSAYELAMERLDKTAPSVKLTDAQKAAISELETRIKARIAEKELSLKPAIEKALDAGEPETAAQIEEQLRQERLKLLAELEEKKEAIRQSK